MISLHLGHGQWVMFLEKNTANTQYPTNPHLNILPCITQSHLIPSDLFCFGSCLHTTNGNGPLVPFFSTDVTSCVTLQRFLLFPLTKSRQIRSAVPPGSRLLQECEKEYSSKPSHAVRFCYWSSVFISCYCKLLVKLQRMVAFISAR